MFKKNKNKSTNNERQRRSDKEKAKKSEKKGFFKFFTKSRKEDKKKQHMFCKFLYIVFYGGLISGVVVFIALWLYSIELTKKYNLDKDAFSGALWELPSQVYARPLELYVGKKLRLSSLEKELKYLDYKSIQSVSEPGTYYINGGDVLIYKKSFRFWDKKEKAQLIRISVNKGKIIDIINMNSLDSITITRIEPVLIGSIYPANQQDRILIKEKDVPNILKDGLIASEDRRFYSHFGVDLRGLARAVIRGLQGGGIKQGASTITQQYIKNHYLTNKRKLSRKVKEALMAIVIEQNYSKEQILEGYLNEIYLGQDGSRAIHGFGLASKFYFGKKLKELGLHQIASLIALVKEPSRANPFKHPDYAKRRRSLILKTFVIRGLISQKDATLAKQLPLDTTYHASNQSNDKYHSFLSVVYKQLKEHYNTKNLPAGLNFFTTLDPIIQESAEREIRKTLTSLERKKHLRKNFLQAASVIIDSQTAEIVAIVGDRNPKTKGYNRAIQAKRQPGSLLKPAVYLAALEHPQRYNLGTLIDDSPLRYESGGEVWAPKNYTKKNKGKVLLIDALVKSYNIPTARIGLDLGLDDIVSTLKRLGATSNIPEYPSIVLGSVAMSPFEVAQIYETLASGGYHMPLRSIRYIIDRQGKPIEQFSIKNTKQISEAPYYLIIKAMQEVVKGGTARSLSSKISKKLNIAGKTGTTDDYRDSWFAGFSGNYLNVVWVGNDDNKKTKLSGSTGALPVWRNIMSNLNLEKLDIPKPDSIKEYTIDTKNGLLMTNDCKGVSKSRTLPFIVGYEPTELTSCYVEPDFEDFDYNEDDSFNDNTTNESNTQEGSLWYNLTH